MTNRVLVVLASVLLASCARSNSQPADAADVAALTQVSGASLADTTAALAQIEQLVGVVPGGSATSPATIADVLAGLQHARDAVKANETTLGQAIADVDTQLAGGGTISDRAATVLGGASTCSADLATASASLSTCSTDLTTASTSLSTCRTGLATANTNLDEANTSLATCTTDAATANASLTTANASLATCTTDLATANTNLATANTNLTTANTNLATASASLATANSSATALLAAAGASSLADVTTLISNLEVCSSTSALSGAKNALCSNAGYATLLCPAGGGGSGGEFLIANLSGLSSFTVTTAAALTGTIVTVVGNDGTSGQSYAVDTSAIQLGDGTGGTTAIAAGGTIVLTDSASGSAITLVNTSGSSITSASALAAGLADTFRAGAAIVGNNTCANIATAEASLTAADTSLATCSADLSAAGATGATCASDLSAASASLSSCTSSLATDDTNLATCATSLSTCDVNLTAAGASGATCASNLSTADASLTSCTANLSTSNTSLTTCTAGLSTADASLITCTAGLSSADASLTTCSANLSTSNASLTSCTSGLSTANASLTTCTSGLSTADASLTTCTAGLSTANASLTSCSSGLSTCNATLVSTNANLAATNATLATTNASLTTCSSDLSTDDASLVSCNTNLTAATADADALLSAANASTLADVTALISNLETCSSTSALADAEGALCSNSGYAALLCPSGGGGSANDFLVVKLSGLSNFTVTSAASTSGGGTVNMVVNDGTAGDSYTAIFSSAIPNGGTFALANGPRSITLLNTTGASITSVSALASALASTFPVGSSLVQNNSCTNFAAEDTSLAAINADADTLITTAGSGVASLSDVTALIGNIEGCTGSSLFNARNQVCTAQLRCPSGGAGNEFSIQSVVNNFIVDAAATSDGDGGANMVINLSDGRGPSVYNASGSSLPLSANSILQLVNGANVVALRNTSGSTIATSSGLVTALANAFPTGSSLVANTCAAAGTANVNLATCNATLATDDASLSTCNTSLDSLTSDTNAVLTAAGSGAPDLASLAGLITSLETCSGTTALTDAKGALCSNAGYAALLCPNGGGGSGGEFLVTSLSGLSNFTVTTAAVNSDGIVSMVGSDGSDDQTYSVDTAAINLGDGTSGTSPIPTGGTVVLVNNGNAITVVNLSAPITNADTLASDLADTFRLNAGIVHNSDCSVASSF